MTNQKLLITSYGLLVTLCEAKQNKNMFIILHGEDTFRSRQKLNELQEIYLEKNKSFSAGGGPASGWNYEKFDATEMDFRELKNVLEAQSLFAQKRFIIIENLSEGKKLLENLQPTTYNLKPNVVVFYERADATKDKDYKKILKQADRVQEFKKLTPSETANYFSKLFPEVERSIVQKVLNLCKKDFSKNTNPDVMWQVYNELKKLLVYKLNKNISDDDLTVLNVGHHEGELFPTIDAIFQKDANKAFYNLLLHWQGGEHPQIIFNMIEMQLKNIAIVKEAQESGRVSAVALGLHPYVVKKALSLVDRFSWDKVSALYERVKSLDLKNKTGQISPHLASELLVVAIIA